jgi:hypothetical protein
MDLQAGKNQLTSSTDKDVKDLKNKMKQQMEAVLNGQIFSTRVECIF